MNEVVREEHRGYKLLMLTVLGFCGSCIYYYPFIRYVFIDWQNAAMGLTNAQNGLLITVFGICEVTLFVPSGLLADKFSPKKTLMAGAVWVAAALFITAFNFDRGFGFSVFLWFFMAIPGCLYWAPLFKEMRLIAGEGNSQGFYFGWYYMCNGLSGGLLGFLGKYFGGKGSDAHESFFIVSMVIAICMTIACMLLLFVVNEKKISEINHIDASQIKANEFSFSQAKTLLKMPALWALCAIVLGAYGVFTTTAYYSQYLVDVYNVDSGTGQVLQIFRQYIFYVVGPISGFVGDKLLKSDSKWFSILFTILLCLVLGMFIMPDDVSVGFLCGYSLLPGLFGLSIYSIQFSSVRECLIPVELMGTATGLASVIGFSTDLWLYAVTGGIIDRVGNAGYTTVFIVITILTTIGLLGSIYVARNYAKYKKSQGDKTAAGSNPSASA